MRLLTIMFSFHFSLKIKYKNQGALAVGREFSDRKTFVRIERLKYIAKRIFVYKDYVGSR